MQRISELQKDVGPPVRDQRPHNRAPARERPTPNQKQIELQRDKNVQDAQRGSDERPQKKMAADRRYRKKKMAKGNAMPEAWKGVAIDLTGADDFELGAEPKADTKPKLKAEPKAEPNAEAGGAGEAEEAEEAAGAQTSQPPKKPTARELAMEFKENMSQRREEKRKRRDKQNKKTCKKSRGSPTTPKTTSKRNRSKSTNTPDDGSTTDAAPAKRSRDSPAQQTNSPTDTTNEAPTRRTRKSAKKVFKYSLGTKIARDFGVDGIFVGSISTLFKNDPSTCRVTYTDGDEEDMDEEEIEYGIQLFGLQEKLE